MGHALHTFDWGPRDVVQRCTSLLANRLFDGFAFSPRRVLFYLTYNCNLRCKMCWWWGKSGIRPDSAELSTEQVKSVVDWVRKYRPTVSFTGGEVLTRSDILQILGHTRDQGLRCEIFTNGTLITPELAKHLVGVVDRIMFSIEGPEGTHDRIRGRGSFEKTTRGIRLIREAAEECGRRVSLRINCVISSLNLPFLADMVDVARALECHLTFEHLMFASEPVASRHKELLAEGLGSKVESAVDGFVTDYHRVDASLLTGKLREVRERAGRLGVSFAAVPFLRGDRQIEAWYANDSPIEGLHCIFPWAFLHIRPDGAVAPCEFISYDLGSAIGQDVSTIWNGTRARNFRRRLKAGLLPGCTRCCELLPKSLV